MKRKETKQLPIDEAVKTELQKIKEKQEMQALIFSPDALLPQKPIDRELEYFQLRGGDENYNLKGFNAQVNSKPRYCEPMFPNSIPFFRLMFKLLQWYDKNPNEFIKPAIVAYYIKKYIYGRFDKDILPTLLKQHNPLVRMYIRKYKLYYFLNDEGLILLEKYIKEAIEVMKISDDWYDFEVKYSILYNLPERKLFN